MLSYPAMQNYNRSKMNFEAWNFQHPAKQRNHGYQHHWNLNKFGQHERQPNYNFIGYQRSLIENRQDRQTKFQVQETGNQQKRYKSVKQRQRDFDRRHKFIEGKKLCLSLPFYELSNEDIQDLIPRHEFYKYAKTLKSKKSTQPNVAELSSLHNRLDLQEEIKKKDDYIALLEEKNLNYEQNIKAIDHKLNMLMLVEARNNNLKVELAIHKREPTEDYPIKDIEANIQKWPRELLEELVIKYAAIINIAVPLKFYMTLHQDSVRTLDTKKMHLYRSRQLQAKTKHPIKK